MSAMVAGMQSFAGCCPVIFIVAQVSDLLQRLPMPV